MSCRDPGIPSLNVRSAIGAALDFCVRGTAQIMPEAIDSAQAVIESIVGNARRVLDDGAVTDIPSAVFDVARSLDFRQIESMTRLRLAASHEMMPVEEPARHTLFEADRLSIVAIGFQPGVWTPAHDHYTECVSLLLLGQEQETSYWRSAEGRWSHISVTNKPGQGSLLGRGDIHSVGNPFTTSCLSLHFYFHNYSRYGGMRNIYRDAPSVVSPKTSGEQLGQR